MKENYLLYVVLGILLLFFISNCNKNREIRKLNNEKIELINNFLEVQRDIQKDLLIINQSIDKLPTWVDLEIEGLKTEKRMIQSTDRRILDVNRQSTIDSEIRNKELERDRPNPC